jgi:60 kDa SS-A/Ro ribonucleoprotein
MCVGSPISTATAAQAVAITLARLEPNAVVVNFDIAVQRVVPVTPRTGIARLRENTQGDGTDVSAPVWWALGVKGSRGLWRDPDVAPMAGKQVFDAFAILTDDETWAGSAHPSQVLEQYRREVNPAAKLVCCSMAANHANIIDPNDALSLGCAGLDANLPVIVSDFIGR